LLRGHQKRYTQDDTFKEESPSGGDGKLMPRPVPWNLIALTLGTVLFLSMPYSLYLYTVVAVSGFIFAGIFLLLSPFILAYQYVRYKRGMKPFPPKEEWEG
jgi:hypothetical protein